MLAKIPLGDTLMLASQELRNLFADYTNIREAEELSKHQNTVRKFAQKLVEEFDEFAKASRDISQLWETFEQPIVEALVNIDEGHANVEKLSESNLPHKTKQQIQKRAKGSGLRVKGIVETDIECPRCQLEGKQPVGRIVIVILYDPISHEEYTTLICGENMHYGGEYLEEDYLTVISNMVQDSLEAAAKRDKWAAKLSNYYQNGWFTHEYVEFSNYLNRVKETLNAPLSKLIPAIEALLNFTHGRGMLLDILFGVELARAWRRKERMRQLREFILKSVIDALKSLPPAAT